MATQAERRSATRARIVAAARPLFAKQGYDETATEQILKDAGVSRGALYHHFETKRDVFEAVFIEVSDQAIHAAAKSIRRTQSPLEDLIQASLAWLGQVRRPAIGAIVLALGPQVLGWKRARDLEARTSLQLVRRSLERAIEAGEIEVSSIELSARFINAMLAEAALARLHGESTTTQRVEATLRQFLSGIAVS